MATSYCYPTHLRCIYNVYKSHVIGCPGQEHLKACELHQCPHMFKCLTSYCIPTYLLCDGVQNCPNGEDEQSCERFTCAGLLRCRYDNVCVHPSDICDGHRHCLMSGDDERFCNITMCPPMCTCHGSAITCKKDLPRLKTLSPNFRHMMLHDMYIHSKYQLQSLNALVQLHILDSSFEVGNLNDRMFSHLTALQILVVCRNGIQFIKSGAFIRLIRIRHLDLTGNRIKSLTNYNFKGLQLIGTKISHWLHSNKLLLNTAKSKFMVFFKHPKAIPKLKLTINDNPIEQVTEFNFLGITIDHNVTWNAHITKTSIKIARVIGILHKLRHSFPQRILRLIYNSLIHPHLIYGLYLWGFNPKRLTILQKRAVRILALRPYLSHSTPLFKSLKIPKLADLYIIQLYKLYYKNVNNLLPSCFRSFTPQFNDDHHHDLRYNILRLPMTKREYFVQCTRYQFLKLIRETPLVELNRSGYTTIVQFSGHFKYTIINQYDPICTINNCHICGLP